MQEQLRNINILRMSREGDPGKETRKKKVWFLLSETNPDSGKEKFYLKKNYCNRKSTLIKISASTPRVRAEKNHLY